MPRSRSLRSTTTALIQAIEPRRMLSASLASDGTLLITGTERSDAILVSLNKADPTKLDVSINRAKSQFTLASITSGITIRSLGGNDQIKVSRNVAIDVSVFAGAGNDRISLGAGNDTIDAATGNDSVDSGTGNDLVLGGAGNDNLIGGTGDDTLSGDDGNDKLTGNDGKDSLSGNAGNDNLSGGTGDDNLSGDAGNDNLLAGTGDDRLLGGAQNDALTGNDGNDDLLGGDGKDRLSGGRGDDYLSGGTGKDSCRGEDGSDTFDSSDDSNERPDRNRRGADDVAPSLTSLPQPVQDRLSSQFPNATILKLKSEDENDIVTHFELLISQNGVLSELKINLDGTVRSLETEDSGPASFDSLPEPIRTHFNANYPGATIVEVDPNDNNGTTTRYEIKFNFNARFYEIKYAPNGTVLKLESGDGSDDNDDDDGGDRGNHGGRG